MADMRDNALCALALRHSGQMRVETIFAKEDTEGKGCLGKPLGCCNKMDMGLQCGLSGNPSACGRLSLKGNRIIGDDFADGWENMADLCRKLYHIHCPIFIICRLN